MSDSGRRYGVRKRGKKWQARPFVNGKHHWGGTFDTEDEALRAAMKLHDELKRLPASQETVSSFQQRWLEDYPRPKASTNDHYRQSAGLFAREHGTKRLREFSRLDARRFARDHATAAKAVRIMFSDALDEGLIESNPFAGLKSIGKPGRKQIKVLTAEEVETLLEVARDVHSSYDFWQLVAVAFYTGMRPSEIYGLEWRDIDIDADEIHVRRQLYRHRASLPKNGRTRQIILPPPAKAALKTLAQYAPVVMVDERGKKRPLDLVFRNRSGDAMSETTKQGYWSTVRSAFEAMLSPERREELRSARDPEHPHMDLYEGRHFCATYLLEKIRAAGGDGAADVATQLGHTDDGKLVKDLYGHPSDQLARERLKRLFEEPTPLRPVEGEEEAADG